jgi:hypothetical protein
MVGWCIGEVGDTLWVVVVSGDLLIVDLPLITTKRSIRQDGVESQFLA